MSPSRLLCNAAAAGAVGALSSKQGQKLGVPAQHCTALPCPAQHCTALPAGAVGFPVRPERIVSFLRDVEAGKQNRRINKSFLNAPLNHPISFSAPIVSLL